jgi:hypothetical protein
MVAKHIQALRSKWETYAALVLFAGTVTAFASLPARVERLEARMDRSDTVDRYVGCWLKATSEGRDPRACESHLTADVLDYLKPSDR